MSGKPKSQIRKAAVLKYNQVNDFAPRLVGKGSGFLAEKIIALAREKGIPVVENPDLLKILMQLDENQYVPENLYQIVAEIYAFILKIEKECEHVVA